MRVAIIISAFLISLSVSSQVRVLKPVKKAKPKYTNLALGAGIASSVLFLERNVKSNNDAHGIAFTAAYGGARMMRVTAEYIYYYPINIDPTWYNIHAYTIESNGHIIAKTKSNKDFFYPLFGLSYNHFQGYFTGKDDFQSLAQRYAVNSTVVTNWVGLNVGTGYEHFFGPVSVFLDYKMRIGANNGNSQQQSRINIMDICITAGIRGNLRVPTIYKMVSGSRQRYFLDKEKE
jgi:hypothetical protein